MTEKELGKLSRHELLELLLEQTKRVQILEAELSEKSKQLADKDAVIADKDAAIADRRITLDKAGSIAEAALQVSKIFETAQTAADIYLKNIEVHSKRGEELLTGAKIRSEEMLADATKRSEAMLSDAKTRAEVMLSDAKMRCAVLEKQTAERVKAFKDEIGRLNFDWAANPTE